MAKLPLESPCRLRRRVRGSGFEVRGPLIRNPQSTILTPEFWILDSSPPLTLTLTTSTACSCVLGRRVRCSRRKPLKGTHYRSTRLQPTAWLKNRPARGFSGAIAVAVLLALNSCASNSGTLQSRIESKLNTPDTGHVQIGTATYNRYSRGFEEPWPFGPYSD